MTDQYTTPCNGECGDYSGPHDSHLTAAGRERFAGGADPGENIFKDCSSVGQVLRELTGFRSVCWKMERVEGDHSVETYRTFDSEKATMAAEHAEKRIAELVMEGQTDDVL